MREGKQQALVPAPPDKGLIERLTNGLDEAASVWESQCVELETRAERLQVNDEGGAKLASLLMKDSKVRRADVERFRTITKAPFLEAGRAVDAACRAVMQRMDAARKRAGAKLQDFRTAQQAELRKAREAEQARIDREKRIADKRARLLRKKGQTEQAEKVEAEADELSRTTAIAETVPTTTKAEGATVSETKRWDFEVEDLGHVPRQFLTLDKSKVREAINAGERTIPGIRIFQKTGLSVR